MGDRTMAHRICFPIRTYGIEFPAIYIRGRLFHFQNVTWWKLECLTSGACSGCEYIQMSIVPAAELLRSAEKRPYILIVDDDTAAMRMLSLALSSSPFEIETSASADAAMK